MKLRAELFVVLALVLALMGCTQAQEPSAAGEGTESVAEPVADPTPGEVVANGILLGRSGTPMADAQVILGRVLKNEDGVAETIQLGPTAISTVTDAEGRFELKDFTPGEYAVVYQPSETSAGIPPVLIITSLLGGAESFAPLLIDMELGTDGNFKELTWGVGFCLMDGHTLYSRGNLMNIWNASVRTGGAGPYVEMRHGNLVTVAIDDNCEIELDAWSY